MDLLCASPSPPPPHPDLPPHVHLPQKHLLSLWQEKRRLSSLKPAVDELSILVTSHELSFLVTSHELSFLVTSHELSFLVTSHELSFLVTSHELSFLVTSHELSFLVTSHELSFLVTSHELSFLVTSHELSFLVTSHELSILVHECYGIIYAHAQPPRAAAVPRAARAGEKGGGKKGAYTWADSRNLHVLQQFQERGEREEQIRSMQGKVGSERRQLQVLRAEVERVQGLWLPRLRSLIVRINEAFSRNFLEMAITGEVALGEQGKSGGERVEGRGWGGGNVRTCECGGKASEGRLARREGVKCEKVRECAELQDLSAHLLSGGERSVSTILYLVSLQDLTRCPFRVVDEINQGMDPTNERNMFQQLVRAATHDHTPQCFLLTPKLLPDLDYGEAYTVHCVMNGVHAAPLASTPGFKQGEALWDSLRQSAADA
ncbi:unnamed protein product [Closterium sp. Naga37s-1]|nr:unnamed protein product [Closterium sp. Naga37s-1]